MKICKYLSADKIFLDIALENKEKLIQFLAQIPGKLGYAASMDDVAERLRSREKTMSTGIGNGVAIPHAVHPNITDPILVFVRPESSLEFDALDNEPVDIIFGLIMPERKTHLHIQLLAGISRLCKNEAFIDAARTLKDPLTLLKRIQVLKKDMEIH